MNHSSEKPSAANADCSCGDRSCGGGISRRDLLRLGGAAAAASLAVGPRRAMAGPFTADDFEKLVPADKKLSDAWVRSLFERGEPEWFAGEELKHIGMAVGGICCGHVYLGGDGVLWHWDVFNQSIRTGSDHYRNPMQVASAVDVGFALRLDAGGDAQDRSLDTDGFADVQFRGAYPLGMVEYSDDACPVTVSLEAFSPFAPLDVETASLPLTVMRYTVRNKSGKTVTCRLTGHLANPVLLHSGTGGEAELVNTVHLGKGATSLHCTAEPVTREEPVTRREDIVFDDFESDEYQNWSVEGTAFGKGPITAGEMPAYQGDVGAHGKRLVNSHNTRQGEDVRAGDTHTGKMTSKPFTIERSYINFLIGGGAHRDQTCLNLLVDGKVAATAIGHDHNRLRSDSFDVRGLAGKTARLEIVDRVAGGWGNIGVDNIVFSDKAAQPKPPVEKRPDWGDMTLALLDESDDLIADAGTAVPGSDTARGPLGKPLKGTLGKSFTLAPGDETTVTFTVAWRFANMELAPVGSGHYYATRFKSSRSAAEYLAERFDDLYRRTRLWHDTWYDSTLPYWLLDRTFINVSTLATSTCLRVSSGRFWGWEGVRCCPGTCSHVWHYAQAVGRVFPELERMTREKVDFGLAFHEGGRIDYRGEFGKHEAIDGQCGTILRVLREHQMSADDAFLRRVWPRVRQSIEFLMAQDGDANGVLEGAQYNTLDAAWHGPISWISSLYLAALRAGASMAGEMGDSAFRDRCTTIADRGSKQIVEDLFNGEYFYQKRDPKHPEAFGAGIGCHIDQVFGQGWAHQLALPRVLPQEETVTALRSLWRYNFTPDVGPYRQRFETGRWYAMPGEAGLIMCTFPKGGEREARGDKPTHGFAGYLNECMNGFEYQAAGHMIAEGLVEEGLAVARAIHDRYHPSRRNPFNEIECGDHYARSMASYGVYVSVCGFEHHGPKGHIGFAPKISPEDFRAAFIAAEGWGTFRQSVENGRQRSELAVRSGRVRLRSVSLAVPTGEPPEELRVTLGDRPVEATLVMESDRALVRFDHDVIVSGERPLAIELR